MKTLTKTTVRFESSRQKIHIKKVLNSSNPFLTTSMEEENESIIIAVQPVTHDFDWLCTCKNCAATNCHMRENVIYERLIPITAISFCRYCHYIYDTHGIYDVKQLIADPWGRLGCYECWLHEYDGDAKLVTMSLVDWKKLRDTRGR